MLYIVIVALKKGVSSYGKRAIDFLVTGYGEPAFTASECRFVNGWV